MTAIALVLGAALALSGCTFVDQDKNKGKAGAPVAAVAAAPTGPTPMDTFRALAPPEGMKFTPLFAVPLKDDDERFRRLENGVQALRNDFDTVTPTLVRLAAIEKDIRELVGQLQTLTDGEPIAETMPVQAAPVASVTATPATVVTEQVTRKTETVTPPLAPAKAPPAATAPTATTANKIPGKDITGGTELAVAAPAPTGPKASSLPVTPEAAPTGKLPPDGAASPNSKPALPPVTQTAPAPKQVALPPEPLQLQPVTPPAPPAAVAKTTPVVAPTKTTVTETVTKKVETAPVVAPVIAPPAAVPPQQAATPAAIPQIEMGTIVGSVRDLRVGDHIDKTRVVLDVTQKANYKATLDNNGRRLIIQLPQYDWKAAKRWDAASANLVANYSYANGVVVLDLLAPAAIRSQSMLPSDGGGQRLVIDLFAQGVHVE